MIRLPRRSTLFPYTTLFRSLHLCLEAAERLATEDGVSAEVVDVRTIAPLDKETILSSVRKTSKAMVVYEDKDRKSTRLNSSHTVSSYAVFCLKKKSCCSRSRTFTCTCLPRSPSFSPRPRRPARRGCFAIVAGCSASFLHHTPYVNETFSRAGL